MARIRLDAITFDAGTQVREAISEQLVAAYGDCMAKGDRFPPVVLFHDGNQYYMADGFHRGLASQRLGSAEIEADVRPGTKVDALWFALGANRKNGERLKSSDLRHAVLLAFQTWPDRSARELAEQIGCMRW